MSKDVLHSFLNYDLGFSDLKFRHLNCYPGYTYGSHQHSHIEIGYVKSGSCAMEFGEASIGFNEGDTMVVYPGSRHYFTTHNELGCKIVQLEFMVTNLSVLEFKENPDENLLFLLSLLHNTRRFLKISGNLKIRDNMERLVAELERTSSASTSLARLYFFELFIHLSQQLREEKDILLGKTDRHVVKALQYLHNNFLENPDVVTIAEHCGISSRYLRKLFMNQTGIQLVDYKHHLRMKMANELLRDNDLRLTEIAYRCGYTTQQYFCKVFRDFYGMSPRDKRSMLTDQKESHSL